LGTLAANLGRKLIRGLIPDAAAHAVHGAHAAS
jgi:hypothetical protein